MFRSVPILCLVLAAAPATAGGPGGVTNEPAVAVPTAPTERLYDWTGFYAGLSASSGAMDAGAPDMDTQTFGAQAGYLHDLGRFVLGGEVSYSALDFDDVPLLSAKATRLKLIGGLDAGRVLPYAFIGVSDLRFVEEGVPFSDSAPTYGIGARFAIGAQGRFVAGVEYLVETKDEFAGTTTDIDNREFALRLDYRFQV